MEEREYLERVLARLPPRGRRVAAGLMRPDRWWLRLPLAMLLILGGVFSILPILGLWMLPLGALLLAQDVPVLRRPTVRSIEAVERWWERRGGRGQ